MSAPAPASPKEVHHAAPRCLLRLHDEARDPSGALDGAGIQAWLEWEWEAMRWGVPAEIAREDLEGLIERSTVLLEREKHRLIHGSDFKRWGLIDAQDLNRARVIGHGLPIKDDVDAA